MRVVMQFKTTIMQSFIFLFWTLTSLENEMHREVLEKIIATTYPRLKV